MGDSTDNDDKSKFPHFEVWQCADWARAPSYVARRQVARLPWRRNVLLPSNLSQVMRATGMWGFRTARSRGVWIVMSLVAIVCLPEASMAFDNAPSSGRSSRNRNKPETISPRFDFFSRKAKDEEASELPVGNVSLNFFHSSWSKILQRVAEESGKKLVMERIPKGRFSRRDGRKYELDDAIKVLNRELEPENFRLITQGDYLVLLHLPSIRKRYHRPQFPTDALKPEANASKLWTPENIKPQSFATDIRPQRQNARPTPAVRQVNHETAKTVQPRARVAVRMKSHEATEVSRILYKAFQPKVKLVGNGPEGLPAFQVTRDDIPTRKNQSQVVRKVPLPGEAQEQFLAPTTKSPTARPTQVQFTVGIDTVENRLVVEAPRDRAFAVARLIRNLDHAEVKPSDTIQFVSSAKDVQRLAQNIGPTINRLVRQQTPADEKKPAEGEANDPTKPGALPQDAGNGGAAEQANKPTAETTFGGLKGEVKIEYVPGVGFILRGNEEDVKKVEDIIRLIEDMSVGTTPDITVRILRHVHSEALAELLTSVYENLGTALGQNQREKTVAFTPVIVPNAIIIVASASELESINALIKQLDQPVDPRSEYMVFSLENAVATQVLTTIEGLYEEPTGLGPRVKAIADARTNTVVVQASPNDMEQIIALIQKLDRVGSGAINQLKVFPLVNAVAEELAETLNLAIQSVVNPPATVQGQGQFGSSGAGRGSEALREARSAVIEYMTGEGDNKKAIRSGVLSDIRINPDSRINSLIVTAPKESMALIEELIKQFDKPTATVADIKHFSLKNADARDVVELLQELFVDDSGDENQVGVQLAGAEDASSNLIPLKFSVDVRTNSIFAVGGKEALEVVEALLLRLDQSDVQQRQNIVFRLKNSPATEIADSLNLFMSTQRDLAEADPDLVSAFEQIEREVIVVPEPVSNSLLISASPRYFDEMKELVMKLDEAPAQVTIQALIVEVTLENNDEFGIELGIQDSVLFDRSATLADNLLTITRTDQVPNANGGTVQTTTQQIITQAATPGFLFNNLQLGNNTSPDTSNAADLGGQALSNFSLGRVNGDLGFGGLVLSASSDSLSLLLRALSAKRRVDVLSRPLIRALDNQEAQIQVGQEVPRITNFTTNQQTGVLSPIATPDPAGIILIVTPRISPDGNIVMEVVAQKSQFDGAGVDLAVDINGNAITAPIKDITEVRTTVAVPNNQTIVLGGMITKTDDQLERKVPWLGDIPLLGQGFRFDGKSTRRTELLIFLTPKIIRDPADSELIKQIEAERLNFIESDAEEIHGPLYAVPEELQKHFMDEDEASLPMMPNYSSPTTTMPGKKILPPPPVPAVEK
ncbi:MAG: hypothetical protein CMJ78_10825 [Planctomycetaceae bacterium]|nr:hypothetical protein [Planctomycetaceae bacterium]